MKYLQNRKARLAAGIAGAALAFSVASPAFAQAVIVNGDDDGRNVGFYDASQVQFAGQIQTGDVNVAANGDSNAYASVDQSIVQNQFNAGLGDLDSDGFSDLNDNDDDNDGLEDIFE